MRPVLNDPRRFSKRVHGDDGLVIVYAALLLVFFLVVAAIVVDLGNAREQDRQAVAAADAAALAGAQAINKGTVPGICSTAGYSDANCIAAFDAFTSSNIYPPSLTRGSTCSYHTVVSGKETCYRYQSDRATVEVTSPYVFGSDPTKYGSYVNVRICWDAGTSFARVIGQDSVHVCGNATAFNSGSGGTTPQIQSDCSVEDNFEDAATPPNQQLYVFDPGGWPAWGGTVNWNNGNKTVKNNEDIVVIFDGHGTELGFDNSVTPPKPLITWWAPTTASGPTWPITANGNEVVLPYISGADKNGPDAASAHGIGYVLESLDTSNKIHQYDPNAWPASAGNRTVIAYSLPGDGQLKPNGQNYVYHSTLQAIDSDNAASPPTHCGEADWTFNHDGSFTTACKEDSFFAYAPDPPSSAQIQAGTTILSVYYVDESPLENIDSANWPGTSGFPASPNFGIDFHYTLNGVTQQIQQYSSTIYNTGQGPSNPNGMYWLEKSDANHTKDKFNTTIKWQVPSSFATGSYTIFVKAYDTDHPGGGDCGIQTWSATITGNPGTVTLVE